MRQLLMLYVGSGLVLSGLSIPLILGRVPPNPVYGFRLPSTLCDPTLWFPVNRVAGKWLLVGGVAIALAAVLFYLVPGIGVDRYALCELAVVIASLLAAVAASVIHLRHLQTG